MCSLLTALRGEEREVMGVGFKTNEKALLAIYSGTETATDIYMYTNVKTQVFELSSIDKVKRSQCDKQQASTHPIPPPSHPRTSRLPFSHRTSVDY